jgi:hypothetical protein
METGNRQSPSTRGSEPPLGAHLVTPRRGYWHHGIYVGEGRVVHYAGFDQSRRRGPVEEVSLARFAAGQQIWVKPDLRSKYAGLEAARRARSRIGENHYRLLTNNCEHFCMWCLHGEHRSEQVEALLTQPLVALCIAFKLLRGIGAARLDSAAAATNTAGASSTPRSIRFSRILPGHGYRLSASRVSS